MLLEGSDNARDNLYKGHGPQHEKQSVQLTTMWHTSTRAFTFHARSFADVSNRHVGHGFGHRQTICVRHGTQVASATSADCTTDQAGYMNGWMSDDFCSGVSPARSLSFNSLMYEGFACALALPYQNRLCRCHVNDCRAHCHLQNGKMNLDLA